MSGLGLIRQETVWSSYLMVGGTPDEMLSARAWRLREQHPTLRKVIDGIFFWDKNHCEECYEIEQKRKQLPAEYQQA